MMRSAVAQPSRVPCPGGCGGEAELEPPMVVIRDGIERTISPAVCRGTCPRVEGRKASGGLVTRPARFDVEIGAPRPAPPALPEEAGGWIEKRALVKAALRSRQITQSTLSRQLGISQSNLSTWLRRGAALSLDKIERIVAWATAEPGELVDPELELAEEPEVSLTAPVDFDIARRVAVSTAAEVADQPDVGLDAPVEHGLADTPTVTFASPADVMLNAICHNAVMEALADHNLALPAGARLTISLEWSNQ